jgi:hypothetical protein
MKASRGGFPGIKVRNYGTVAGPITEKTRVGPNGAADGYAVLDLD